MANNYTGNYLGISKGEQVRAKDMTDALNQMEKVVNKKQGTGILNSDASDSEYPSSKLVGANLDKKENISNKKDTIANNSAEYPSSKAVYNELVLKENANNKVTSLSGSATDIQYPSAKATYKLYQNTKVMMPDYARKETINRITTSGGTWQVDRVGYVRCSTHGATVVTYSIYINNQLLGLENNSATNNYVTGVSMVLPVKIGDVVKIIGQNIICEFIPPTFRVVDTSAFG